jgi:hypothetical protein
MNKLKILVINDTGKMIGGAESYVVALCSALEILQKCKAND